MKRFLGMVAAAGFPFGGGMALYFMSLHGTSKGVVMGVSCGLLFGLAIAVIRTRRAKYADEIRPQFEAEGLLRDAAAARIVGRHIRHGWLFLTKQRLVFAPSKGSASDRLELPLADISSVKLFDQALRKQVVVVDKQNLSHAFVTMDRELWVISITRAVAPESTADAHREVS